MEWKKEFVEALFTLEEKKSDTEGAYKIKNPHLPKSIFKYREINSHTLKDLDEDTIWLSSPQSFSDPYDCAYNINLRETIEKSFNDKITEIIEKTTFKNHLSEESIKLIKDSKNPFSALMEEALKNYPEEKKCSLKKIFLTMIDQVVNDLMTRNLEQVKNNFKLASFSECNDSIIMWAHYSKLHKGFCLEYDISKLDYTDFRRRLLYPVIYSDNMLDASKYFEEFMKGNYNILYLSLAALTKPSNWCYEKEWRLIFAHGVIPTDQSYYMGPPKRIFLGSRIDQTDESTIIETAKRKNISVYKMKLVNGKFELIPEKIL